MSEAGADVGRLALATSSCPRHDDGDGATVGTHGLPGIDVDGFPQQPISAVPAVTAEEMAEVDRIMVEDLVIELVQMMENAGSNLADLAVRRFEPESVLVLCGAGGNGGGGLAAARHLVNRGSRPKVVLAQPPRELAGVPGHQFEIVERMGVPVLDEPEPADLVIDALIGYSLRGTPRGHVGELIYWINDQESPVLSLDTPSGLDVTTGEPHDPFVRATATMTLALPKTGLVKAPEVGELYLADISVPPGVYRRLGMQVPAGLFADGAIVRLVAG